MLLLVVLLAHVLTPPPGVRAERLAPGTSITLDGRLDEAAWAQTDVASGFTQMRPDPGAPASQRTEVLVLYDDTALYVGFRCFDEQPEAIVRRLARRDEWVASDRVFVGIDSYGDSRTAFLFGVNAAGVRYDLLVYDDVREDDSWDAVWDAAVAELPEGGWAAELRIPLSQLRFTAGADERAWGIQFQRDFGRSDERLVWAPFSDQSPGIVSAYGRLSGLRGLRAPRGLEVLPYVATALDRAPGDAADPYYRPNDLGGNAGVDVRYGLSSTLTLSATVNPDFGQVEADPAEVNLTAFETFLEERRPFFVEGVDAFQYGRTRSYTAVYRPTFFYSRRIGRAPRRSLDAAFVEPLRQTPIAAAGKLSGRAGAWTVGALSALTLEQQARFTLEDGTAGRAPVEPLSHYGVARARRAFGDGATLVGGMLASTERRLADPAFADLLPARALVAGLDGEHVFGGRAWAVSAVVAASHVAGDPAFVTRLQRAPQRYFHRPDARHLRLDSTRTHLAGGYAEASIARLSGKLRGSATVNVVTAGFDTNDLGFQQRADGYGVSGIVLYNESSPRWRALRRYSGNVNAAVALNGAGDVLHRQIAGNVSAQLASYWGGGFWMGVTPWSFVSDRLTRGGPLAVRPPEIAVNPWIYSDDRKPVYGNVYASARIPLAGDPGHSAETGIVLTVRATDALRLSLGPSLSATRQPEQYVDTIDDAAAAATFGRRYVFARMEQRTAALALRASWALSPVLTIQLYAQPFVSAGRFDRFKELAAPGTARYTRYGLDRGTLARTDDGYRIDPGDGGAAFDLEAPDFRFRSLRGGGVLRWEYRPGSTLFVVWQQQRSNAFGDGSFDLVRDAGALFRDAPHDVFLVKLSYWLSR